MILALLGGFVQALIVPKGLKTPWETLSDKLPNGLEYLLINCLNCSVSSASLSVKVGTKDDKIPGIAHLLEHMIFYSSVSYPEEGYLSKFLSLRNGFINAYTSLELTNFYFSVQSEDFWEALSIFSKSFFEASLEKSAIKREVQAVHSEHMKNLNNDDWISFRVLQILMGEDYGKFGTGNEETLSVEGVEEEVSQMYSDFYIGSNMKLVVYGKFQLKEAENSIFEMFQRVRAGPKSKGIQVQGYQSKLVISKRLSEGCGLNIYFQVIDDDWFTSTASALFLTHLIGNQGKKGIRDNIHQVQSFQFEVMETFKSFRLIRLEFLLNDHLFYQDVLSVVFDYLRVIKEKPFGELQEAFNSFRRIRKLMFDYLQINKPEEFVSIVSENMQMFSSDFYVSGFEVLGVFDYQSFLRTVDQIFKSFPMISLSCRCFEEGFDFFGYLLKFDQFCGFYDLNYEFLDYKVDDKNFPNLDISNSTVDFLSNLTVIHQMNQSLVLKQQKENFEIWYQFNDEFNSPKVTLALFFTCEDWDLSEVEFEVRLKMIEFHLNYYETTLMNSGFSYSFEISHKGAVVILKGWNQGIFQLFQEFFNLLKSNSNEFQDESISNLLLKYSSFKHSQLFQQSSQLFADLFYSSQNDVDSKIEKLRSPGFLAETSLQRSYFKILIFGNVEFEDSLHAQLQNISQAAQKPQNSERFLRIQQELKLVSEVNYCLFHCYDFGEFDPDVWSQVLVLEILTNDLVFRVLRTQLQLGYVAFTLSTSKYQRNSLVLVLQGTGIDPDFAEWKVESLWQEMSFTQKEVQEAKKSLVNQLEKHSETFDKIFDGLWREIVFDRYLFEYHRVVSQAVRKVQLEDISKLIETVRKFGSTVFIQFRPEEEVILTRNAAFS